MTANVLNANLVALAFFVRVGFIIYGNCHDRLFHVRYTDIDYDVFSDAASLVHQGKSPYLRPTYRYTPLLAWLLTPNVIWASWGKFLFVLCDMFAAYFLHATLVLRRYTAETVNFCTLIWLLNPVSVVISSRGNAESVMSLLVVAAVYCLCRRGALWHTLGGLTFGLAVHTKIYPITYTLPIYLYLNSHVSGEAGTRNGRVTRRWFGLDVGVNKPRLCFFTAAAAAFCVATLWSYWSCGDQFINEAYLYHITRRDARHNLSVYFYLLYLTEHSHSLAGVAGLAAFLPQLVLLLVVSLKFYEDLPFCCFLNTFIFVMFNKVCTTQYYSWYLCFIPLIIPNVSMSLRRVRLLALGWLAAHVLWLSAGYLLEFQGRAVFPWLWLAGLALFAANACVALSLIRSHVPSPVYRGGQIYNKGFHHVLDTSRVTGLACRITALLTGTGM